MRKIILTSLIFFLIIFTTFTKNATKELEKEIFLTKENIGKLKNQYDLVLLDYNYLSSPKRLTEFQEEWFDDQLFNTRIDNINKIFFFNGRVLFQSEK
ncbi:MAG: hypothetical protein CBE35_01085 [Candidatus Pelagibacter sp. TMED275]|nr:MAG: hypothetical protein CBE35_01085 [Candidatus Pelagibacter sp. TMED275]|tara:strand:+ start:938 stop:1231 length:294 start_codon:yes stop_codon:yes gene_type:complete